MIIISILPSYFYTYLMRNRPSISRGKQSSSYHEQSKYLPKQQSQKWKQSDIQAQKVIQDQHYSNNIMMTALSTLQSLEAAYKNSRLTRGNKVFGYYDKVDFSDKNYNELKSQLQTHLMLLKASRQVFDSENKYNKYELPGSFNQQKVYSEISRFKTILKDDKQVVGMCNDFQKINEGKYNQKMNFQEKSYAVKYSETQKNYNRGKTIQRGIYATNQMEKEKEKVQKLGVKTQKDLPIFLQQPTNYKYQYQYRHTKL